MKETRVVTLRMHQELYVKLKEIAEKEHRSVSQQINLYLEQGLKEAEKEKVPS